MVKHSIDELLREAFKAGWKERDKTPGLKRQTKRTLDNAMLSALGGGHYADVEYVKDHRQYHNSIWLNSAFKKQATLTSKGE